MNEKLIRPSSAAKRLGVSKSTIYRWYWEDKLRGIKLTKDVLRIYESSIEEMLHGVSL